MRYCVVYQFGPECDSKGVIRWVALIGAIMLIGTFVGTFTLMRGMLAGGGSDGSSID